MNQKKHTYIFLLCAVIFIVSAVVFASLYKEYKREVKDVVANNSFVVTSVSEEVVPVIDAPKKNEGAVEKTSVGVIRTPVIDQILASTSSNKIAVALEIYVASTQSALKVEGRVEEGSNVYDLLVSLRNENKISFKEKYFDGLGYYIQSINEVSEKPSDNLYWQYKINGQRANVGISTYILTSGDVIRFELSKE